MKLSLSIATYILLLLVCQPSLLTQTQKSEQDNRPRSSSISGRVTVGGKPVVNARVEANEARDGQSGFIMRSESEEMRNAGISIAVTDGDGRFSISGLPAGRYSVFIKLWAYVSQKKSSEREHHRTITLAEGETVDNVDFTLVRGGVITGQVTDANGKPLIERHLQLRIMDEQGQRQDYGQYGNWIRFRTDDRGIYRLYGLRAGRYLVSVGGEQDSSGFEFGFGKYPRTYYPGATDENQAKIVELKEGEELTGINIRLGDSKKTYEALGRIVDNETGKPVPKMTVICAKLTGDEGPVGGFGGTGTTDEQGNFRLTGLTPGKYHVNAGGFDSFFSDKGSPYYFEPVKFEINSDHVSNIELRAKRGGTISGVAVVEGVVDPSVKSRLQKMGLTAQISPQHRQENKDEEEFDFGMMSGPIFARIGADGSFRMTGIRPGKVSFQAQEMFGGGKLLITRIERNGAEMNEGIDVQERENVTGVRIVFSQGSCVIRGQVNVTGGTLPDGWRLMVFAHRDKSEVMSSNGFSEVDGKNQFVIEGLLPGDYTLNLHAQPLPNPNSPNVTPMPKSVTKKITVTNGEQAQVTMTLDLSKKEEENRQ